MKLLITSGGTSEPIDAVRVLTNSSTGRTGAYLADFFASRGAEVTLLRAERAIAATHPAVRTQTYVTTAELRDALREQLTQHAMDALIHAAAVSDYHVAGLDIGGQDVQADTTVKRPSAEHMTIRLSRAPKLINTLKGWSRNSGMLLIGFKLTQAATPDEVQAHIRKLVQASRADYVVHNDQSRLTANAHPFTLFTRDGTVAEGNTKEDLAIALSDILENAHAARA